jgi:Outer membrane receptor proteins, mostly Fe transport
MKCRNIYLEKLSHLCALSIVFMMFSFSLYAQNEKRITGTIVDENNVPVAGAAVLEKGTTKGVFSNADGYFELSVSENSVLEFSFIGFFTQEIPVKGKVTLRVVMKEDAQSLSEVLVIGYGSVKKNDLTGSVTAIDSKKFTQGVVSNPASLITGKVAGVQIISNGGRAGDGNRIRIRGGASLNASNDPLIVLDGVPIDNNSISGMTSPLSTINPNDIESMNILKDASATAIYGSRASNGVIIITTKKASKDQKFRIDFSSQNSIATIARTVDLLSADEFREAVTREAAKNPLTEQMYLGYLGNASTDWQKEIFRNAFTTDNNISINDCISNFLPYRVSAGFFSQDGTLKTDNMKRGTLSLSLSPKFFDDHLSVNMNLKGTYSHSRFGNGDAIGAALRMDPTKPVKADGFDNYNGYWNWLSGSNGNVNTMATKNPVALLYGKDDQADVYRSIGNIQLDYKLHFLPELRANVNFGYDISQGTGDKYILPWSPEKYAQKGEYSQFKQEKQNILLEYYLNYTKEINEDNRIEVMAGYTYQDWKTTDYSFAVTDYAKENVITAASTFPQTTNRNTLISFYGRLNYNFKDKYLLTATLRRDGSSRFGSDNRWGTFPSVALAWRLKEEGFLKNIDAISNLKLRVGYGVTGQQEGIGNYDHIAKYTYSDPTARVQFGNQFYYLWRPDGYDPQRKWEQTATTNIGIDWGFNDNRVSGSIDYYYKHTTDLLNEIPVPMGSNFINKIVKNIGSLDNRGIEANVNYVALDKKDMRWDIGFNITYNHTEISKLSMNDGPESTYIGAPVSKISGGTSSTIQIHSVGYAPYSFYVYKQLYDVDGKPIEGAYADMNGNGKLDDGDLYRYKSPEPDVYMGLNTSFSYKKLTIATALRASLGNYAYNNVNSDMGNYSQTLNPNNFLMNTIRDINNTGFYNKQLFSDYYIENASFLKMDYLQFMYDLGKFSGIADLKLNFSIQNVFTITKYKGIDPEIAGGIDNNFYPNPRTFSLGLSLNF